MLKNKSKSSGLNFSVLLCRTSIYQWMNLVKLRLSPARMLGELSEPVLLGNNFLMLPESFMILEHGYYRCVRTLRRRFPS